MTLHGTGFTKSCQHPRFAEQTTANRNSICASQNNGSDQIVPRLSMAQLKYFYFIKTVMCLEYASYLSFTVMPAFMFASLCSWTLGQGKTLLPGSIVSHYR